MGKGNRKRNERAEATLNTATPNKASVRKKGMPTWVGTLIVLVVVGALVIFAVATALNSHGTFNRMRKVIESDNYEVTVPMMSYMVYTQYQNYVAQIQSYSSGSGTISIKGDATGEALDTNKSLRDQIYSAKEGEAVVTWFDHFVKQAEDNVKQVLACCEAAREAGMVLDDADYEVIGAELSTFDTYAASMGYTTNAYVGMMYGTGVRIKDVEDMMELTQLATKWTTQKSEEFFNNIDMDRINQYYADNQSKYDAFCDIIGFSFTASFTPDKNGDAEKNAELAAEYAKDQERFAKYFDEMKTATTREELTGKLQNILTEEARYQFRKENDKADDYELTEEDHVTISEKVTATMNNIYMENVADNDFTGSLADLDTWLFESKTEDDKTVYQRKEGETKELNTVNNVVTEGDEAYKAVTSTYGFYIFLGGMHRDYSPSVGHILFKNDTYDGLVNSNKLTGLVKILADRLFTANKDVPNYVLTADAMAAELVTVMKEAGKVTEAQREVVVDGQTTTETYYKISKEAFETYGTNYTEDSNVFYDGVAKGVMVAPFENWAYDSKRVEGELSSGGIETDYGYHVMFYTGIAWQSSIHEKLATDDNNAYLESLQEGRNITVRGDRYKHISG